ncbi:hypothetical protein PFICI_02693 [Pestalotiopsis fici W106-1]|uniref:Rhodopsin domain-containing protein n=1 Tax=Pestalotiopsis fici (strain W106-1 / CGMCC3.15140) TaxID=1229662 RepID=W3XEZ0_PESFW|nr:uncharacterized protein PFICI_02693 [Pestalotiopsis fici W106-1]ETS84668.1 hypothetical protein PFICI_02693 [Pestalotiopsis fici W106-1]
MNDVKTSEEVDTCVAILVGAFVAILATISVAFRCHVRYLNKIYYKADDWLILISFIFTIGADIAMLYSSSHVSNRLGYDESNEDTGRPANSMSSKITFIGAALYFTITSTTKLSILLMYQRLFSINSDFRYQVRVLIAIVVAFWTGCTIAGLVSCISYERAWVRGLNEAAHCQHYNAFWTASGILESIIDVMIIILPLRIIYRLQMSKRNKLTLIGVFLLVIL